MVALVPSDVAPTSRRCRADVTSASGLCRTDVGPMAVRRRSEGGPPAADVVPMSGRCRADVAPMSGRCRTDVAPMAVRQRADVGPMSGRRRAAVRHFPSRPPYKTNLTGRKCRNPPRACALSVVSKHYEGGVPYSHGGERVVPQLWARPGSPKVC